MRWFTEDGIQLFEKDNEDSCSFVYFSWEDLSPCWDSCSIMNLSHGVLAITDDYIFFANRCGKPQPNTMIFWADLIPEIDGRRIIDRNKAEKEGVVLYGVFHDRKKAIEARINNLNKEIEKLEKAKSLFNNKCSICGILIIFDETFCQWCKNENAAK